MISVRPGSLGFRVLALIVDYPGELDAQAIADHVFPPPRLAGPASYEARRALADAKATHRAESAARVSRVLGRLQAAGLIERRGPPRVAAWFTRTVDRHGLADALHRAHPAWPGRVPRLVAHLRVLGEVVKPTGAVKYGAGGVEAQAYRDLVAWGVVVSPSRRFATPKGVALVVAAVSPCATSTHACAGSSPIRAEVA
jgi:hypothetical protein